MIKRDIRKGKNILWLKLLLVGECLIMRALRGLYKLGGIPRSTYIQAPLQGGY